ncbi:hypothetical protein D9M73_84110 [compost metagenome]|jgi:hypothetical protein
MIIYVPGKAGERKRLAVDRIQVQAAASPALPTMRTLVLEATTSAGPVEIVLSAGEAATLMFDIGYGLEQAHRLSTPDSPSPIVPPNLMLVHDGDVP